MNKFQLITPIIIAKAKGLITSPPNVYKHIKAIKLLILVIIVLDKVLLIDKLNKSGQIKFFIFS